MKYTPCVDVIVPFYYGNDFINDALKSIFNNKYVSCVFIVVDSGSCPPIINDEFSSTGRLNIIYNQLDTRGAGIVRSIGYNKSTAEFVAFLDCDDVWASNKLEVQIPQMIVDNMAFSFHGFAHFLSSGKIVHSPIIPKHPFRKVDFYKKNFTIGCLSVVINKQLIGDLPLITLKRRNDYMLWDYVINKCDAESLRWGGIADVLGFHRITPGSLSASKFKSIFYYYKFLKLCGLSFPFRVYCWASYLLNTVGTR